MQRAHYYSYSNQISNETGDAHSCDYREVVSNLLEKADDSQNHEKGVDNFSYLLIFIPFASLEACDRDEIQRIMFKTIYNKVKTFPN